MGSIAVHCNTAIPWQAKRAPQFVSGLKSLGFDAFITDSRNRVTDIAILLGTTFWRSIERDGRYLLVDRASVGDPDFVQLVWDGHGRRGDHKVPEMRDTRLLDVTMHPWDKNGKRVILCGQTETYSPHYWTLEQWYDRIECATHFRHHPAGRNGTTLPLAQDWTDAGRVITLNSSVGVESVLNGIPTVTMDEAALAWDVTAHDPEETYTPDRNEWLQWLSWTQWHWDEIEAGDPIRHLFEDI